MKHLAFMKILMVCLGNICRSPLAEGIMRHKINEKNLSWEVDSAGTSHWHIGDLPDKRSIAIAKNNGIDITYQQSRQIIVSDLDKFDLILAMDSANYSDITRLAKTENQKSKVKLILNFSYPNQNRGVPDPYYDGGFEKIYKILDEACKNILNEFIKK